MSFGQTCPQAKNATIDTVPVSCFKGSDGSLTVTLKDSANYSAKTPTFKLFSYVTQGSSPNNVSILPTGSKYRARFSGLSSGIYDVQVSVPGCASFIVRTAQGKVHSVVTSPTSALVLTNSYQICQSSTIYKDTLYMDAQDPAPSGIPASTGLWSQSIGPNTAFIFDKTDYGTYITGFIEGDYRFIWTVSKTGCSSTKDTTTINYRVPSTPYAGPDTIACAVSSYTMKATAPNSFETGLWTQLSGPNTATFVDATSNKTSVSNLITGVYKFIWTLTKDVGCSDVSDTVTITNNVIPSSPTASISPNPICEGKTLSFSLSPVSSTTSYKWTGPHFSYTHTGAQALPTIASVALTDAGSYSVVATLNGCSSASIPAGTLVVNAKPAKTTITPSANPVCQNSTLSLTANTASSVIWTLPSGSTSTANPLSVTNMQSSNAGKYKVQVSSGLCSSDADSVTIVVTGVTTPTIAQSGSGTYCSGAGFTLTASPTITGATYTWTKPSGSTVTGQTLSISNASASDAGSYSVKITANGCTGSATTSNVTITTTPSQPSTITGNTAVCQGDNNVAYSVTSVAGVTYAWTYTGGTGATITGSGASVTLGFSATATSGVLNVTATSSGCTSTARTLNITVNPIPAIPAPASNSPICAGQTLNLTTATQGAATFAWTGPNSFNSTSQNPSITNATTAASGTYSVKATLGTCTSSAGTVAVTVKPTFSPTASSNTPVCAGSALNLTASAITGATYAWTGPNSFTSTSQNPTIASPTTAASGTYSVIATVAGCAGTAATTSATVNAVPAQPSTITGKTTVCQNDANVSYSVTSVAGVSYVWAYSGTGATIAGGTTNAVSITFSSTATSGTLSVNAVLGTCTSTVRTQAILVNSIPSAPTLSSNTPVCVGNTLNLTAATVTGATYAWTGPNSFTSTTQNPSIASVTSAAGGTYSATVTVGGCVSTAGTTTVVINPLPTASASNDGPTCLGGTLQLSAATVAGATYAWTGPNSFSSTSQNPSISSVTAAAGGTYTLKVTQNSCVSAASTTTVTISPVPSQPSVISGKTTVCKGDAGVAYSITSVAGLTYAWSYTGTGGTVNGTTNSITLDYSASATSGNVQVIPTLGSCSGPARTLAVTVNPIPTTPTVSSNSPVCLGSALNLTTPTVTGATYTWTGPNSFTSTSQNPTIASTTAAAAGTYSLIVTVNNCSSLTGTATVSITTLPSAPTAASNTPVCIGGTLNLTASTVAGATYAWTGPNSFTSTSQNPTITSLTSAAAGTYNVTAKVGTCTSSASTTTVVVNSLPAAPTASSNSPLCVTSTLNLTASTVTGATYSWTGPNSFTSTSQNPTIASVTTAAAGTYSVSAILNGCTGPAGTTTVVVNSQPAAPTASSNSPVCLGSTLNLTTPTVTGATYAWTGPNGFTSTSQNPTIASTTAADAGTYSVTTTVSNCTSLAGTTTVSITTLPSTPTASSNTPVCVGGALNLTASTVAGATYSWTGPNSFTSTSQNPSISNVTAAAAGTYSVTAKVGTCTSTAGATTVVVNTLPAAPTVSSNSPLCVTSTLNLTASTITGATYSWSGPNSFTSTSQNPTIASVTTAAAGTYSVSAILNGCTGPAGTTTVVVNSQPAAPTASSNSPVCLGSALNLTTPTVAGATYAWTGPNGFTSTSQNPTIASTTAASAGTYSVTTTVSNCTSLAGTTTVSITSLPSSPTASSNTPICVGGALNLTASTVTGATYAWTGPNSFTSTSQNPSISSATAAAAGTYSVTAKVGSCTSLAGTTTVVINTLPTAPTVSSNSPLCVGSALNLTASTITGATYAWTGPNSFTSTSQNPSIASVTTAAAGTYSVIATVGTCSSLAGTTTVVVNTIPSTPTVSSNSPVCLGSALNLTTPTVTGATYAWTGPNGFTSTSQNPTISNTTAAAAGSYSVVTTVNNCTSAAGSATVSITTLPAAPTASSNTPVCVGSALNLTAGTVAGATYAWTGPNGFSSTSQNPTIASVTAAANGPYNVSVTVGSCTSTTTTTTVVINSLPAAPTASSNTPVCVGGTLSLAAGAIGGATYSWTGPNGFTATSQTPTISSVTAAAAGTYSVTASVSGCTGAAGTTTVAITPIPSQPSTITGLSTVCQGASAVGYSVTNDPTVSYIWNYTGTGATITGSTNSVSIDFSSAATAGTLQVTAISGTCSSTVRTLAISITPIPSTPTVSSNSPICAGSDLNLTASTITGATYSWTGPNGFTSLSQNPTLTAATTSASGTYSVTAFVGSCGSTAGNTTVTVNNTPSQPSTISGSNSVCQNRTGVTYSVAKVTGVSYVWSYSGTGATIFGTTNSIKINFSNTATSGTLSVVATAGACTSSVRSLAVKVNTSPAKPILVMSNSPLCVGQDLDLAVQPVSDTSVGFSWTLPDSSTFDGVEYTKTGVDIADQGNYIVTAYVNNCLSAALTIPVSVIPGFAPLPTSNSPVCVGDTLKISSAGSVPPSATYTWTGPNGFTSTKQSFTIANAQLKDSGTYTVTAHVGTCNSSPVATQAKVNPIPSAPGAISGGASVCQGTTGSYSVASVTGVTYTWTYSGTGATFPSGNTGNSVTVAFASNATSGTLQVVAVSGSCKSTGSTMAITLKPKPTSPTSSITSAVCQGDSLHLSATSITGATYAWTGPNSFTSAVQNPVISDISAAAAGKYIVTFTLNGCVGDSDTTQVAVNVAPDASFAYARNIYCHSESSASPLSVPTGSSFLSSPSGLILNSSTGAITFTSSTVNTYKITNTITNSFGCKDTASFTLSVANSPIARTFTYASPICNGSSIAILPSFTSTGDIGTFKSSSGLSIDATTGAITPNTSTAATYQVVYTATAGTCVDSTTSSVTLLSSPNKPTLAGASTLCQGTVDTLKASLTGFTSFDWYQGASLVQSGKTSLATTTAGSYFVNTKAANGCLSPNSDTISVTIKAKPSVPFIDGVCSVSVPPATLSTQYSSQAGYGYTWLKDGATTANTATLLATTSGKYAAFVTETATGCSSDTSAAVDPFGNTVKISLLSGTNPICSGDSLLASSNSPSGNVWTLNGVTIANTPTTTLKTAGKLVLKVTNGTCSGSDSTTIIVNPSPSKPVVTSATDSLCAGDSVVLATSSSSSLQWTLNGISVTGATSASLKVGQGGAYRVVATNGTCSTTSDVKNIGVKAIPATPLLSLTGTQQICQGDSLKLSISNFVSGQDAWYVSNAIVPAPAGTAAILFADTAGTYKVIRTSNGCKAVSDSATLIVNPTASPTLSLTQSAGSTSCQNTSIRYLAKALNVGTSPVYQWFVNKQLVASGSSSSLILDTLTKTSSVKVTVISSNTCSSPKQNSDSVTTKVVSRFQVSTTVVPIGCSPTSKGKVTFTITGGSGAYAFGSGELDSLVNNVAVANTYPLTIFDDSTQCSIDTTITIGKASKFTLSAVLTQPTCFDTNGAIGLSAIPSTGSYAITSGVLILDSTVTGLKAGTYAVSATDLVSGCSVDTSFALTAPNAFTTAISVTQPDCGQNNGVVKITPSPSGTYTFFGDFNKATTFNVPPGVYTVSTSNGTCTKQDTIKVAGKALFEITAAVTQPTCTNPLGAIRVGTLPKIGFKVSGDLKDTANFNLAQGTYQVILTDTATGCFKDSSFVLKQQRDFTVDLTATNPTCFLPNGTVRISLTPDTALYQITGDLVDGNNTGLSEGDHTFRALHLSSGCLFDTTVTLVAKNKFTTAVAVTQPDCGVNNGIVTITPSPAATYTYTGDLTSAATSNLSPNTYIVKVSNGICSLNDTIEVSGKATFQILADTVQPSCTAKGSIKLSTMPKIDFIVSKDLTDSVNTGLSEGTYAIRITDKSTGCFKDTSYTLKKVVPFSVKASFVSPACKQANGSIVLTMTPGPASTYTFTGKLNSDSNTALTAGTYPVTIADKNGCTKDTSFTLASPADFTLAATLVKPVCNSTSGEIDLLMNPSPNSAYTFSGDLTSDINKNLASGTYKVTVVDKNSSCTLDTTLVLGNQTDIVLTATVNDPGCTSQNGSISLNVLPSNANYDFTDAFATSTTLTGLGAGSYHTTITPKGSTCFKDTTFVLKSSVPFSVSAIVSQPSCNQSDGSILITPTPVTNSYTYKGDLTKAQTTGLAADTFTVHIKDTISGCTIDTSFTLKYQADFKLAATLTKPACGKTTGMIALSMIPGPNSDYTFGKDFSSDTLKNIGAGKYEALITKAGSSCSLDTTLFLGNQTDFSVSASIAPPTCGKTDGSIKLKVSKGTSADYTFTGQFSSDSIGNIGAGNYEAIVTENSTGCIKDTSFTLEGQPDFTLVATTSLPTCNKSDGSILLGITPGPASSYAITGDVSQDSTQHLASGTYVIHITQLSTSCAKDTTITLVTPGAPLVSLGKDDTLCSAKTIVLKAQLTDSLAVPYTYAWYVGGDSLTTHVSLDTLSVTPDTTTQYIVSVSNGAGCPGMDTIRLVRPAQILFTNTSHVFSHDGQVQLDFKVINPKELTEDSVFIFKSLTGATTWTQIATLPASDTVYKASVSVADSLAYYQISAPGKNACGVALTTAYKRNVLIHATPNEDTEISTIDWTSFIGWDSSVVEYQIWRSLDGGPLSFYNSGNLDTLATFLNASDGREQCYRILAIEKGPNGHQSWSNTVCIHYANLIRAYNIFTPNGDGHNDVFFFKNLHFYPGAELFVFNRWGNKVFHQVNYTNDWDGGDLPAGTYFYMLDLKDGSKTIQGDVLLHR